MKSQVRKELTREADVRCLAGDLLRRTELVLLGFFFHLRALLVSVLCTNHKIFRGIYCICIMHCYHQLRHHWNVLRTALRHGGTQVQARLRLFSPSRVTQPPADWLWGTGSTMCQLLNYVQLLYGKIDTSPNCARPSWFSRTDNQRAGKIL